MVNFENRLRSIFADVDWSKYPEDIDPKQLVDDLWAEADAEGVIDALIEKANEAQAVSGNMFPGGPLLPGEEKDLAFEIDGEEYDSPSLYVYYEFFKWFNERTMNWWSQLPLTESQQVADRITEHAKAVAKHWDEY